MCCIHERKGGGGLNLANADVLFREGVLKCWQWLTWGRGVSKITEKVLTYFMDGPKLYSYGQYCL